MKCPKCGSKSHRHYRSHESHKVQCECGFMVVEIVREPHRSADFFNGFVLGFVEGVEWCEGHCVVALKIRAPMEIKVNSTTAIEVVEVLRSGAFGNVLAPEKFDIASSDESEGTFQLDDNGLPVVVAGASPGSFTGTASLVDDPSINGTESFTVVSDETGDPVVGLAVRARS